MARPRPKEGRAPPACPRLPPDAVAGDAGAVERGDEVGEGGLGAFQRQLEAAFRASQPGRVGAGQVQAERRERLPQGLRRDMHRELHPRPGGGAGDLDAGVARQQGGDVGQRQPLAFQEEGAAQPAQRQAGEAGRFGRQVDADRHRLGSA